VERVGRRLARVLLPRIVEEMGGAGSRIEDLATALRAGTGELLADERAFAALESGEEATRSSGFVLGVIGEALGLATLLGRREERGIAWTLALLERALAARGTRLLPPDALGLRQERGVGEGWELALVLAAWLLGAAESAPRAAVAWSARELPGGVRLELERGLSTERADELHRAIDELGACGARARGVDARVLELAWPPLAAPGSTGGGR